MKKVFIPVLILLFVTTTSLLLFKFPLFNNFFSTKNPKTESCEDKLVNNPSNQIRYLSETPSLVDFSSNENAREYKTVISETEAKGSNFAGHFTLATWGCGTDCVGYAVVDTETGKIIAYNPANGNYHLDNISLNSSYFVLEPVYKGQDRKYYQIIENDSEIRLDLSCTEKSTKDMYSFEE